MSMKFVAHAFALSLLVIASSVVKAPREKVFLSGRKPPQLNFEEESKLMENVNGFK